MSIENVVFENATEDVAAVKKIVIGRAEEDEIYTAAIPPFISVTTTGGSGDTTSDIATALDGEITSSAARVSTSVSSNEIEVTALDAGQELFLTVQGPGSYVEEVTKPESAVDITLPESAGGSVVAAGGILSVELDTDNLTPAFFAEVESLVKAGKLVVVPPLSALRDGVAEGNLEIDNDVTIRNKVIDGDINVNGTATLTLEGGRVTGDVVIASGATLLATDTFFEGDVDNSAGGTATLTGGRIMGTASGTVTHTQGAIGA